METKENISYSNAEAVDLNSSIRIKVKASKLFNTQFPVKDLETLIDDCTALIDNSGLENPYGGKNKDFLTYVHMKYNMTWTIELAYPDGKDLGYKAHLVSVTQDPKSNNPNFFTQDVLKADNNIIKAKVVDKPNLEGRNDYYTIHFYISKGDVDTIVLPIDPKLQMRGGN